MQASKEDHQTKRFRQRLTEADKHDLCPLGIPHSPLEGSALLQYVEQSEYLTKVELCTGAGYTQTGSQGEKIAALTAFYEAWTNAKGDQEIHDHSGSRQYKDLAKEVKTLYAVVNEHIFNSLGTAEQIIRFAEKLGQLGIETSDQFIQAYEWSGGESNAKVEFAEILMNACCLPLEKLEEKIGLIFKDGKADWQKVWDNSLRYDYSTIEDKGMVHFFSNDFLS